MTNNYKLNVLKKCIGKRYVIISDHIKNVYSFGEVKEVVDENHVLVERSKNKMEKINIFDIRSPSKDYV